MISLVFLVCTAYECVTIAPEEVFKSKDSCEVVAEMLLLKNQSDPDMPPHQATYKCTVWGEPA